MEGHLLETALRVAELLAIVGGGGMVIFKLGKATHRFEAIGAQQANEISELKDGVKELQKLVISNAVFDQKMVTVNNRLDRIEREMTDLRHGEGFVMPFVKNPKA